MSQTTPPLARRIHQAILDAYDHDALAEALYLELGNVSTHSSPTKTSALRSASCWRCWTVGARCRPCCAACVPNTTDNENLAALCTEAEQRQAQAGAGHPILGSIDLPEVSAPGRASGWLWVNVPPKPSQPLVGRDDLLDDLVARLLSGRSPALSTDGLPGAGKTALAVALAHDARVQAHFTGGILWGGLGTSPDPATILNQWAAAAHVDLADLPELPARVQRLSAALADRKVLVVLDDAWDVDAPKQLRLGCPQAVHLLTTRSREIARAFAGAGQQVHVPELAPDPAVHCWRSWRRRHAPPILRPPRSWWRRSAGCPWPSSCWAATSPSPSVRSFPTSRRRPLPNSPTRSTASPWRRCGWAIPRGVNSRCRRPSS